MASPPGQHAWVPTCLVFLLSTCTFTGMRAAARGSKLGGPEPHLRCRPWSVQFWTVALNSSPTFEHQAWTSRDNP